MRYLAIILLLLMPTMASAQCDPTITDVRIDNNTGNAYIEATFTFNGKQVVIPESGSIYGGIRVNETSGKKQEILADVDSKLGEYCKKIIQNKPENVAYMTARKIEHQKQLTENSIDVADLKATLVGHTFSVTETTAKFKDKEYILKYDSQNSEKVSVSK